jgi:hypothetical protein
MLNRWTASLWRDLMPNYRSDAGFRKRGCKESGKDGAHIVAWELFEGLVPPSGRPAGTKLRQARARVINADNNIRIKGAEGNRVVDRKHDREILRAHRDEDRIVTKAAAARAVRAHGRLERMCEDRPKDRLLAKARDELGEVRMPGTGPGRPRKVKNAGK